MSKKIFITGGTGFLGAYLIRLLQERGESQLYALRRKGSSSKLLKEAKPGINWIEGDIRDGQLMIDLLEEMDQVYHAAAMTRYSSRRAKEMWQVNVEGTTKLVDAALLGNIEKLVYISSIAAIGRTAQVEEFDESKIWEQSRWNTRYGFSKFHGELEVWRGVEEGLKAAVINPSVILGAGPWESGSRKFFNWVNRGLRYYPEGATGWVDVRDVALAAVRLMESDIEKERYIISAENRAYRDILSMIAEAIDKKPPRRKATPFIRGLAWRLSGLRSFFTGGPPRLTKESARQSSCIFHYHNRKSIGELDMTYRPVAQTIDETAKLFLEAKKGDGKARMLPF
jgi:dihydroflavonol-4-reductase